MSTYTADRTANGTLRIDRGNNSNVRSIHFTDDEWAAVVQAARFEEQLDDLLGDIEKSSSRVYTVADHVEDLERHLAREEQRNNQLQDDLFRAQLETEQWEARYDNLLRTVLGHFIDNVEAI